MNFEKKKKKKKKKNSRYIEILYEKFYIISKYDPISNSNVNTVITNVNNIKSSTDSSNEFYNINDNNNRNNIDNNSRISDSENRNINFSHSVNDSVVINNVVNRSEKKLWSGLLFQRYWPC